MLDISDDENDDDDQELAGLLEEEAGERLDDPVGDHWSCLQKWVSQQIREMYANQYEMSHGDLPQGPSCMHHILLELKNP
jgi:hypothetical protein